MAYLRKTNQTPRAHKHLYFDHKDVEVLKVFINPFGQIEGRYRSSMNSDKPILREYQQKRLSKAIKRARFLALMPYIQSGNESDGSHNL